MIEIKNIRTIDVEETAVIDTPAIAPTEQPTAAANGDLKTCPSCGQPIKIEARICRYCKTRFDQQPAAAQVYCLKCKTSNPPTAARCQKCGADLLPGDSWADRVGYVIGSWIVMLICGAISYSQFSNPSVSQSVPIVFGLMAVMALFYGPYMALRGTPMQTRYVNRAKRHIDLNPQQAVDDFTHALELAPEKERGALLEQRSKAYAKLGNDLEAARDQLQQTYAPEPEGLMNTVVSLVDADGFQEGWEIGQAKEHEKQVFARRRKLFEQGKVSALGYCTICKAAVTLDRSLGCPIDAKHGQPRIIHFVMPDQIEAGRIAVLNEAEEQSRARRMRWIVAAVLIVGLFLFCNFFFVFMRS